MSLLSDPEDPRHRRAGLETSCLSYWLSSEGVLVRVRTYGFPGCFTRPPGTSTRDHRHEPTASKPVVPVDVYLLQCSVRFMPRARGGHRPFGEHHSATRPPVGQPLRRPVDQPLVDNRGASSATFAGTGLNQVDAVPGRFEEPFAGRPESLPMIGGAASHLSGLALCGSGSASSSNVRLSPVPVKSVFALYPHIPKKSVCLAHRRLIRRRLGGLRQ